jgi:F0F1-type ATP synthase alpha subunit
MTHILTQEKNRPVSLEEQVVLLYALKSPAVGRLDSRGWKRFKAGIFPFLLKTRSAPIREIAAEQRLTPALKARLDEGLEAFLKSQRADEEAS